MTAPVSLVPENYLTYQQSADYLGITSEGIRAAVRSGRLHPVKVPGISNLFLVREEVMSQRRRGRRAASAPDYPAGAASSSLSFSPAGSPASEAAAPLVSNPDLRAYVETYLREATQAASAIAERSTAASVREVVEGIKPITEAVAETQRKTPAPPSEEEIARYMGAARVAMAQLLVRFLGAFRPLGEAQIAGRPATQEDMAPLMELMRELTGALVDTPVGADMAHALDKLPDWIQHASEEEARRRIEGAGSPPGARPGARQE